MKIKIGQEVTWLGKRCKVTELKPTTFAALAVEGVEDGVEEYILDSSIRAFVKENTEVQNEKS